MVICPEKSARYFSFLNMVKKKSDLVRRSTARRQNPKSEIQKGYTITSLLTLFNILAKNARRKGISYFNYG